MVSSLNALLSLMHRNGAVRIYAKQLATNDNSKNQIYLGGDFTALNIIPHGAIQSDDSQIAGSKRDRAKAAVRFFWIDENGKNQAPNAGLILYPKYPEVRMSGFLKGCDTAPSEIMRIREEGRILFLGITASGEVLGHAVQAISPIAREFESLGLQRVGVFAELPHRIGADDPRTMLLNELRRIHESGWINSQKLDRSGRKVPYSARNGGGYSLEAELGVRPNGYAAPDFLGWEIKQYAVSDFRTFRSKSPVTLMTPEPTGGLYHVEGVGAFLRRFGYPDKSGKAGRVNFGGRYDCNRPLHSLTGLRMVLTGYDTTKGKMTDLDGAIQLVDAKEDVAASWDFPSLMAHWNRKHAQAAYVPSLFQTPPPQYRFGSNVLLCEGTDFLRFLKAISECAIYYDPGIRMTTLASGKYEIKRRSQFRVAHSDLTRLYERTEKVKLA